MKTLKNLVKTETLNVEELMMIKGATTVALGCDNHNCNTSSCTEISCNNASCKNHSCNSNSCGGYTCSTLGCGSGQNGAMAISSAAGNNTNTFKQF